MSLNNCANFKWALQRGLAENHSSISESEFTTYVDDHCFVKIIDVLKTKINLSLIISNLVYVLGIINGAKICDIFSLYILNWLKFISNKNNSEVGLLTGDALAIGKYRPKRNINKISEDNIRKIKTPLEIKFWIFYN